MPLYYFDLKNGVPVRDRKGHECADDEQAILYSMFIARRVGNKRPSVVGKGYYISVVNENGTEIHQEPLTRANTKGGDKLM